MAQKKTNILQRTGNFIRRAALLDGLGDAPKRKQSKERVSYEPIKDHIPGVRKLKTGREVKGAFKPDMEVYERVVGRPERIGGSSLRDFHALAADDLGKHAQQARKVVTKDFNAMTSHRIALDPKSGNFYGTPSEQLGAVDSLVRNWSGRIAGSQSVKAFRANREAGEAFSKAKTLKGAKALGHNLKGLYKSAKVAAHVAAAKTGAILYKNPQGRLFDIAGTGKYVPVGLGGTLSARNLLGVAAVGYGASRMYHYGMPADDPYGTKRYRHPWQNPRDWSNQPYFDSLPSGLGPKREGKRGTRRVK